ncbi:unnamed protein product [Blepharisma stoltei]|uniref:Uncharacterized protein n=1 Tax=Blepharisma stoltei TaxID=1481888 RepID=A0AAU9IMZ6_9CILI|nr:unnamed protein product [Blepharisma stoltei]
MLEDNTNVKRKQEKKEECTEFYSKDIYEAEADFEAFGAEKSKRRVEMEEALKVLHNDTKNMILLEVFNIYQPVRKCRDEIITKIGEVDPNFCDWVIKQAEKDRQPVDID